MEELFRSMKFTEKDMIKLSQVKKDIFIKYRRSYKYNRWNRWDFKEAKRLYREKKMITIRLLECTSNFILRIACSEGDIELVNYAISKGANDWNGVFKEACKGGNIEIVKLMISKGVEPTYFGVGLNLACYKGHREIIDLMISICRTDTKEKMKYYLKPALYWACGGEKKLQSDIIERIISLLIAEPGEGENLNDNLTDACKRNCEDIVKLMISGGATYCNNCHKKSFEHILR